MKRFIVLVSCVAFAALILIGGCMQQKTSGLADLISPGTSPVKLNTDVQLTFLEGPAYGPDGNVYFTEMFFGTENPARDSKVWKMDPQHNFSVLMHPANVVNGLMFRINGDLIGCQMFGHQVIQIAPDGSIAKVIAAEYNGKRLDGPNDLVIDRKGGIYITDPRYSPEDTWVQDTEAVYYLSPDGSALTRIIDDIAKPNGILLSPDEKTLFVNNTAGNLIYAFDVQPDGMIANKRDFAKLEVPANAPPEEAESSLADGMCIDEQGNIYCTTNLGIQVVNKNGEHLGIIELPELAANITFGDSDRKALYIAGRTALYRLQANVPGIIFQQK